MEPTLRTPLLPHQSAAVAWLTSRANLPGGGHGGILADWMGLGKTLQIIASIAPWRAEARAAGVESLCTLIVAPKSVAQHWRDELVAHLGIAEDAVVMFTDHRRARVAQHFDAARTLAVVTTYDILRSEHRRHHLFLYGRVWLACVLDEAHVIRKGANHVFRAAVDLRARNRIAVTGTPINNCIQDLVSLCRFVDVYPFCTEQWWAGQMAALSAARTLKGRPETRLDLSTFREGMLLMRSKDILSLPPLYEHDYPCTFTPAERGLYDVIMKDALTFYFRLSTASGLRRFQLFNSLLAWLIRLRQACNSPHLLLMSKSGDLRREMLDLGGFAGGLPGDGAGGSGDDEEALADEFEDEDEVPQERKRAGPALDTMLAETDHVVHVLADALKPWRDTTRATSAKLTGLLDIVNETLSRCPQDRIVVFSQWLTFLDIAAAHMEQHRVVHMRFDGTLTADERRAVLKTFAQTPGSVLLATIQAGGVGVNLTCAQHAVICDPLFNPATELQGQNRVHRIGQTRPVHVYRLLVPGTIEDDILQIQQRKQDLAARILAGECVAGSRLDAESEVHLLFRKYCAPPKCIIITDAMAGAKRKPAPDAE